MKSRPGSKPSSPVKPMRTSPKKKPSPNKENEHLRDSKMVDSGCSPEYEAKSPIGGSSKMAAADNLSPFSKSMGVRRSREQRFNSTKRRSSPRDFKTQTMNPVTLPDLSQEASPLKEQAVNE